MFELKALSPKAIPRAVEKAERYRLLNEPLEAESICLDVLEIDPENQPALITLLLALTDQFQQRLAVDEARGYCRRLRSDYDRCYYAGIIYERRAKAQLHRHTPGAKIAAYEALREAMHCYEQAIEVRPPENDDAMLRWNTCARVLMRNPSLQPASEERYEHPLE
jgi:tetratricopeptide (TPR) repeat protein